MRVIRNLGELQEPVSASVVTIGNFDGVHLAHQDLLRKVVQTAKAAGTLATAITLNPHPATILAPERAPKLLTSLSQKTRLIEKLGIDLLVVLPFTLELSHLSPADFVRDCIGKWLHPQSVFVGPNFRFGYKQAGDAKVLAELGRQLDFSVEVLPMLEIRGQKVSSSLVRQLISAGHVTAAGRLLGRPFSSSGPIVQGSGMGRKQTVPTANLAAVNELLPRVGVYVTRTRLGRMEYESVTNVGYKPTFGNHQLTVESFLLNFAGEIQATEMEVKYFVRLRDEIKFPDSSALKTQIQKDVERATKFFRLLKAFHPPKPDSVASASC